ncbi:hypothetical protein [Mucilaginibacter sp. UR6-11]|uniref:hypothetical protein n=1 Tax=Mucilaginibacter sp. UR6-11 TaxID=1435644 RepID=UPI001E3EFE84|nr:hypothetical protein [Mucilaginibacter sp. UR6-11]MCC8427259.1 hypothetical protein [Mucilaginibacter sp. UR6-11]
MKKNDLKKMLEISGKRAVLGNILPTFRAIAVGIKEPHTLFIKCYLDTPPRNKEYETLSDISAEIIADIDFDQVEEVCEYTTKPLSKLDSFDGFIYVKS